MDRNQVIGIIIIAGILFGWLYFTQPSEKELAIAKRKRDSVLQVQKETELKKIADDANKKNATDNAAPVLKSADTLLTDSAKITENKRLFGDFAQSSNGEKKFYTLENNLIKAKFSTLGGRVFSVELKEYKTHSQKPLILFDGDENVFGLDFYSQNKTISTQLLFFTPTKTDTIIKAESGKNSIAFRLYAGSEDKYIEYEYSLEPSSYLIKFNINFVNVNNVIAQNSRLLDMNWNYKLLSLERGNDWENQNTTIYYKYNEDEVNSLSATSDNAEEKLATKVKWIAFKHQFFASILIADNAFANGYIKYNKILDNKAQLKDCWAKLSIPYNSETKETVPLAFFFGPAQFNTLSHISLKENDKLELQKMVPLGWGIFGWINEYAIIPVFKFLGSFISNYGLIILIMTIIIKIVLFPMTYKSFVASAKMKVLKPQIEEINSKIPKEKVMERQQATMALYRKVGVNPLGGCIPIALQFPFLIALFNFFPASIELRQKAFLWASDLSSYDSIFDLPFNIPFYGDHISLFTLLMAGSIVLTTLVSSAQMTDANSQMPGAKFMMWMMPVMMVFWFNSYSSGLSYYYFLSNMITYGQTLLIRRFVDEGELLKKLNENKKKVVTKSKFQQRLEDMAKQRGYNPPKK